MIEGNLHASYISKTFPRFNGWKNNSQNRLKHLGTLHVYGATRSSHYHDSRVNIFGAPSPGTIPLQSLCNSKELTPWYYCKTSPHEFHIQLSQYMIMIKGLVD